MNAKRRQNRKRRRTIYRTIPLPEPIDPSVYRQRPLKNWKSGASTGAAIATGIWLVVIVILIAVWKSDLKDANEKFNRDAAAIETMKRELYFRGCYQMRLQTNGNAIEFFPSPNNHFGRPPLPNTP